MKVHDEPKLGEIVKESIERHVLCQEAFECFKNMSNNKSPGSFEFTAEFLEVFWSKKGHFVVRSLNFGYERGELSCTQNNVL